MGVREVYHLSPILCRKFREKNVTASLDLESAKPSIFTNDILGGSSLIVLHISSIATLPFIPFARRIIVDGTKQRGT